MPAPPHTRRTPLLPTTPHAPHTYARRTHATHSMRTNPLQESLRGAGPFLILTEAVSPGDQLRAFCLLQIAKPLSCAHV